jgi:hypothetical protein
MVCVQLNLFTWHLVVIGNLYHLSILECARILPLRLASDIKMIIDVVIRLIKIEMFKGRNTN